MEAVIRHAARVGRDEKGKEVAVARLDGGRKISEPCTIIIFGASGDLTERKLIPALFHLFSDGQLPEQFRVIGFARRDKTDESWRAELEAGVEEHSRPPKREAAKWKAFEENIFYHRGALPMRGHINHWRNGWLILRTLPFARTWFSI